MGNSSSAEAGEGGRRSHRKTPSQSRDVTAPSSPAGITKSHHGKNNHHRGPRAGEPGTFPTPATTTTVTTTNIVPGIPSSGHGGRSGRPVHTEHAGYTEHAEHAEHAEHTEHAEHAEHAEYAEHAEHAEHVEHSGHVESVGHVHGVPQQYVDSSHPMDTEVPEPVPVRPQFLRSKSAIVLDTELENELEEELERMKLASNHDPGLRPLSRANSGEEIDLSDKHTEEPSVPTLISWKQGGNRVYVTGSFTGWRQMIKLNKQENGEFVTVLDLAKGTHRMRFLVDGEFRCSDYLPTATDSMGNLVNYIEIGDINDLATTTVSGEQVIDSAQLIEKEGSDYFDGKYERVQDEELEGKLPELEYCDEIPEVFTTPELMDQLVASDFASPPHLPPHLEGVILNSDSTEKDNTSVLPIPNHVVLNHLATTSIKHNVLAVASISRYSRKYVTQVLYAPL
uniref:ARAD1B01144p n=1 Tax=Blastobotrys adeninivorans TaxID=409370 RepID=A0A060T534_BLAAD